MLSSQEITKALPPVRNDEPPSLRREIVDEILDHLHCGLRRELLMNGGDENAARGRVLEKFGDPRQIARQLWFQAMWSKIMTQRLTLFMSSISMLASVALAGMVGWMAQQIAQNNAMSQQQNAVMLEKMASLFAVQKPPEPQRDLHWNNLKIKVTLGSEDGPPAEGFHITVNKVARIGEVQGNAASSHLSQIGADGIDDCGFVGPGMYRVNLTAPWGETFQKTFTIFPGQDHFEHCVAPEKIPDAAKIKINFVGLPELDAKHNTVLLCSFKPTGSRMIADGKWSPPYIGWTGKDKVMAIIFVPGNGTWITRGGMNLATYDTGTVVRQSKWESCQLPVEIELPDYEYSVLFSVARLAKLSELQTPETVQWHDRAMTALPDTVNRYTMTDKFYSSISRTSEWTISIPEEVAKSVIEETVLPSSGHFQPGMQGGFGAGMGGGGFF